MGRFQLHGVGLALIVLSVIACAEETAYLPPPSVEGAQTFVFLLLDEGAVSGHAFGPQEDWSLFYVSGAQVYLLAYAESLSELGLETGELSNASAERSCALASPVAQFELVSSGTKPRFNVLPRVPGELLDYLVPDRTARCERCAKFVLEASYEVDASASFQWALPFGGSSAFGAVRLGGDQEGLGFVMNADGSFEAFYEDTVGIDRTYVFEARSDPGGANTWAGLHAVYAESELVDGQLLLTPTHTSSGTYFVSASSGPDGREIFAGTRDGRFLHIVDGVEEDLYQYQIVAQPSALDVVWLGPGEGIASSFLSDVVVAFRDGEVREIIVESGQGFEAIGHVPGLGVVLTTDRGRIFEGGFDGFEELEGSTLALSGLTIVPYRDGFLLGGQNGPLVQYDKEQGFCPADQSLRSNDIDYIVVTDDGSLILTGSETAGRPNTFEIVRPSGP